MIAAATPLVFVLLALPTGLPASDADEPFSSYLDAAVVPADGFEFPFADPARRLKIGFGAETDQGLSTGETWRLNAAHPITAVADGRVIFAGDLDGWGATVIIAHLYYENHRRRSVRSVYTGLIDTIVTGGQEVRRGQVIARVPVGPADFYLELRGEGAPALTQRAAAPIRDRAQLDKHFFAPAAFIASHGILFVPQNEPQLVLVDQESHAMRLYRSGKLIGAYQVGFGQSTGRKRWRGDDRTPKGMYFVIRRHTGTFDGEYGEYFGGHWLKINYPNRHDAAWGVRHGLVTAVQAEAITSAWQERAPTLGQTKLGGAIGFHGWVEEWANSESRQMSWGCIVMHNRDIDRAFDLVPNGTMVVIF